MSTKADVSTLSPAGKSLARVVVIGGGLAGSEAALQLANRNIPVTLYEMKPVQRSAAHHSDHLAEIVCSNSLGSLGPTASGLLKLEMHAMGSQLLAIAQECSVPAGKALAVDRDRFSARVTEIIDAHPLITRVAQDVQTLPEADYVIIATGPLTSPGLAATLQQLTNRQRLFFFDAASPIVTHESINMEIAFKQDRYNKGNFDQVDAEAASYINCPLDKPQYEALVAHLLQAEKAPVKDFEKQPVASGEAAAGKTTYFESCLPVEVIASRGPDTLRFGPLKPVGLRNPHTDAVPYAVVQLRQDNAEGTLYNLVGFQTNLKWGEQKTMLSLIPGLEQAEVVRYGVMHRNTYVHSPEVLQPTLRLKQHAHVLLAGQLTGTEGYTESIATGMLAGINVARLIQGKEVLLPPATAMLGALLRYITRSEAVGKDFQPINSNWGLMPALQTARKKIVKREKAYHYTNRALADLEAFWQEAGETFHAVPEAWLPEDPMLAKQQAKAPEQKAEPALALSLPYCKD